MVFYTYRLLWFFDDLPARLVRPVCASYLTPVFSWVYDFRLISTCTVYIVIFYGFVFGRLSRHCPVIFVFGISGKLCLPLKLNELQKLKTSIYCCDVHDKAVSFPYQELTAEEFLLHCRHQIYWKPNTLWYCCPDDIFCRYDRRPM